MEAQIGSSVQPQAICARIAARQHGVISLAQARAAGLSVKQLGTMCRGGEWTRPLPGVYASASCPKGWEQDLMAACVWAGSDAVASHRSAGQLWELDGCPTGQIEILFECSGKRAPDGITLRRTRFLPKFDRTVYRRVPVTTPTRTLVDLAAVLDERSLQMALDDALRRLVKLDVLDFRLDRYTEHRRRGIPTLRRLVDDRKRLGIPGSPLESRVAWLLAKSGLPQPVRQYEIFDRGHFLARVDFAYPQHKVIIEVDGYRFHSGRPSWVRDAEQRSHLAALGWAVIVATYERVEGNPQSLLDQVAQSLGISKLAF